MREVKLKYHHDKIVFDVEGKEFYVSAADILDLVDHDKTFQRFNELKPEVRYAELETFDSVAVYTAAVAKGWPIEKIAKRLNTSKATLESWLEERQDAIEVIKASRPDDFRAFVSRLKETL